MLGKLYTVIGSTSCGGRRQAYDERTSAFCVLLSFSRPGRFVTGPFAHWCGSRVVPVALAPHPQYVGPRMPHGYRVPNLLSGQSAPPVHQRSTHALRPAACDVHQFAGHPWDPCWCTCCGASLLAPSGEERTLDIFAQVERAGRCCRRFDSGTHAWCGHATVMVLVSSHQPQGRE